METIGRVCKVHGFGPVMLPNMLLYEGTVDTYGIPVT